MLHYPHVVSTVILAAHWTVVVFLSLRVIARRLPIGVSLAWLVVVFSVPFLGAAAYVAFGGKRLGRRREARQAAAQQLVDQCSLESQALPWAARPPGGQVGERVHAETLGLLGLPAFEGNGLRLFADFNAAFSAWIDDIDRATTSCRLAFYIWHEGGRVDDVGEALLRASARGVRCRILVDALGSKEFLRGERARQLRAGGVEVTAALPRSFRRRADLRNHRKIVVIDDRVGYTGSQNLVDPRFFKQESGVGQWVDAVARIEGPAVQQLASLFELDWALESGAAYEAAAPWPFDEHGPGASLVHVVPSGPAPRPDAIRRLILTAIYSAGHSLTLTTPYFVPDEATLTALVSAARRGVEVTLILPARNDSLLVRYASRAQYDDLLEAGARVALFRDGLLHTKSMVVDEDLCLFGSVNMDMRSFWLNFEISLFVYGGDFVTRISELQTGYLQSSELMDAHAWRARPAWRRFPENAARLLGPLL